TWTDASAGETGYRIERSTDGSTWTTAGLADANVVGFPSTGLSAATAYQYRVIATSAAGDSQASGAATATTRTLAPTGFEATSVSTTEIDLAWVAPAGATGFVVQRSTDNIT